MTKGIGLKMKIEYLCHTFNAIIRKIGKKSQKSSRPKLPNSVFIGTTNSSTNTRKLSGIGLKTLN